MRRKKQIATPRFFPLKQDIPRDLQRVVSKMGLIPLETIAKASLSFNMRYHCCGKCLVCAAVVELRERSAFLQYEPAHVKALIEG